MLEGDLGQEGDAPARAAEAEGVKPVIAVKEQAPVGVARRSERLARDEETDEGGHVDGAAVFLVFIMGDVKAVAPLAERAQEQPPVPERVSRGAVHLADPAIREIDGGGDGVPLFGRKIVEGLERTGEGPRVVVHHDNPVGVVLRDRMPHAGFEPAGAAEIDLAGDKIDARIRQRGQPCGRAIGRGVVDDDDGVEVGGVGVEQSVDGRLELVEPVMGDHDGDQPAGRIVCLVRHGA